MSQFQLIRCVVFFAAIWCFYALVTAQVPSTTLPSGDEWGSEVAGCRMKVLSAPTTTEAGGALDAEVEIANVGHSSVDIVSYWERPYAFFTVSVKDENGKNATKTSYANAFDGDLSEIVKPLGPGKQIHKTIRINRLYDLSESGTYQILLKFAFHSSENGKGKFFEVEAPSFKVKIVDEKAGSEKSGNEAVTK